jgi:hypothetical protein
MRKQLHINFDFVPNVTHNEQVTFGIEVAK